jgi:hypothetical protein
VSCKGTGTKTKQTRTQNTGLKPKQNSEVYIEYIHSRTMINTQDETRNNLRNPQGHKNPKTQHRYSHAPTDIVTIMDSTMVNKGHIYTNTISGNRGQVCAMKVLEGSLTLIVYRNGS